MRKEARPHWIAVLIRKTLKALRSEDNQTQFRIQGRIASSYCINKEVRPGCRYCVQNCRRASGKRRNHEPMPRRHGAHSQPRLDPRRNLDRPPLVHVAKCLPANEQPRLDLTVHIVICGYDQGCCLGPWRGWQFQKRGCRKWGGSVGY